MPHLRQTAPDARQLLDLCYGFLHGGRRVFPKVRLQRLAVLRQIAFRLKEVQLLELLHAAGQELAEICAERVLADVQQMANLPMRQVLAL